MDSPSLSSSALDAVPTDDRRPCQALPGVPLQFRQLQTTERRLFVASPGSRNHSATTDSGNSNGGNRTDPARGGIWGTDAIAGRTRCVQ